MKYQAILFDLDGTLIDNNQHWHEANKKLFTLLTIPEAMKDREYFTMANGRSMLESVQILKERYALPHPVEELLQIKMQFTDEIYSDLAQPMPGADALLAAVRKLPFKTAIASGSPLERVKQIVQRFGWEAYFDELVSVDHVNFVGKPDPAVFSYAANSLGILPSYCVVLEDAVNGVVAAKAAGMTCVVVASKEHDEFKLADHQVPSLADDRLYSILGL